MIISEITLQVEQSRQAEMRETAAKDNVAKQFANVDQQYTGTRFNWIKSLLGQGTSSESFTTSLRGRTS